MLKLVAFNPADPHGELRPATPAPAEPTGALVPHGIRYRWRLAGTGQHSYCARSRLQRARAVATGTSEQPDLPVVVGEGFDTRLADALHVQALAEAVRPLLDSVELGVGEPSIEACRGRDVPAVDEHAPHVELPRVAPTVVGPK